MTNHRPHHWIAVALVILLALLVLRDVHGQTTGSAAMFEGRPALAGAQAGLGAQAGPAQGGLGLQGSDAAQLSLRPPAAVRAGAADMPRGTAAGDAVASNAAAERDIVRKDRDQAAGENRSTLRKTQRALKRSVQRTRHGVAPIDASS